MDGQPGLKARSKRHRDSVQSRPAPAPWLSTAPYVRAPARAMRGREIPGSRPDPVPILSRSGSVSRQTLEFGLRRVVKQQHGLASVASLHAGVVTVVQRFRSDLGLYVHLHLYVPRVI